MKRLLLLLIIPTLSYSQITYEDIMSINSEKTFKRVMIENDFEFGSYELTYLFYGLSIMRDSIEGDKSPLWGGYNWSNGEFYFRLYDSGMEWLSLLIDETDQSLYNSIVEKIKKNCEFYDIIEEYGDDYSCYSCSQSKYKGKIGFFKFDEGGMIRHIIPKQPITYKDIMSINSLSTFNNVMTENGYDLNFDEGGDTIVGYGYDIERDSINGNTSPEWGVYDKTNDEFYFKFGFNSNYDYDFYNVIIDDIKKNCTFYDTLSGDNNRDYISYDCPQSTYKGKIGYTITDSVSYIRNIIQTEE